MPKGVYVRSPETCAKISAAKKGRTLSAEHRAKISLAGIGRHPTPETRARLSAANKGRIVSPDARANLSAAHKGNNHRLGFHWSEEMKAKLSAAHWQCGKQVWEARKRAKRRTLGFVLLNQSFGDCEGHHINRTDVLYIPRELHQSIRHNVWTGKGMAEINAKALAWYTEDWT